MKREILIVLLCIISISFASISIINEKRAITQEAVALEIKIQGMKKK